MQTPHLDLNTARVGYMHETEIAVANGTLISPPLLIWSGATQSTRIKDALHQSRGSVAVRTGMRRKAIFCRQWPSHSQKRATQRMVRVHAANQPQGVMQCIPNPILAHSLSQRSARSKRH